MKNKKEFIIILILFFVVLTSRVFLLNSSIDFFDSMQYVWRSDAFSLFSALSTGHAPHHPGYIFLTYITNNILNVFGIHNTSYAAAIPSAIFGSLTIVFFYLLVKQIFSKKVALLSAILVAITPYFWISNIAIIVDPTMICFYILSLYLFYIWLDKKNYWALIFSGFALGYSVWAHTQIAFWLLGFVALFIYKISPKEWIKTGIKSLLICIGIIFFIFLYLYVLVRADGYNTYLDALKYLFGGNSGDHMPLSVRPGIYNYMIIMTILGALFSIFGGIKMVFDREYKKILMLCIWLIPGLILSALFLYANLYGRSSLICIFPGMILVSYLLISWEAKTIYSKIFQGILIFLMIGQLLVVSIPIVKKYATEPGAYEEIALKQRGLTPGGLYIASNLAKTTTSYNGDSDVIWEFPQAKISQDIKDTIASSKPAYISQDAIMFPFYKYDGVNWEITSMSFGTSKEQKTLASNLFSKYNSILSATSNLGNKTAIYSLEEKDSSLNDRLDIALNNMSDSQSLIIGKITDSNTKFPISQNLINIYSKQPKYVISPERINYRDGLYFLKKLLSYKNNKSERNPLIFTYTDKSGFLTATLPKEQSDKLDLVASSFDLSTDDIFPGKNLPLQFSKAKDQKLEIISQKEGEVTNIKELTKLIHNDSYYVVINKENNKIKYRLYEFDYRIDLSDKMPATSLSSFSDDNIATDTTSETNNPRVSKGGSGGLFIFGPWINLQKGEYKIKYRVKVENVTGEDIGKFYITNNNEPLELKEIKSSDLKVGTYQDIDLNFIIPENLEGVEFKIDSAGYSDIYLDYISIVKIK